MKGSFSDILPEPISEEAEEILTDLLKIKMKNGARMAVRLLHAMEERFGPEAREVVREMVEQNSRERPPRPDAGDTEEDLREFNERLQRGCVGSHRWRVTDDAPDRIAYEFTRCMWAEIYNELGEPELGFLICAGDGPAVRAYNPKIRFDRTKTLMEGDPVCDHAYSVEREDE